MDLLEIKIMTFGHIISQEKLTKVEKIQLLDFVKESTEIQLASLLETGRMKTQQEIMKEQPGDAAGRQKAAQDALARAKERWGQKWGEPGEGERTHIAQGPAAGPSIADKATSALKSIPGGPNVAYAALGAAAITAGVLAYKRFFSKAARACKDKSGAEKSSCMKGYKAQAKQAEIGVLTSKLSSCKGNPKCVNRIKARIIKIKQEVQSLKSKK